MEIDSLNADQSNLITANGWQVFTECDEGSSYYQKGYAWVNRIGYIIFSEAVDRNYINSYKELNSIAAHDNEFEETVRSLLKPIEDKCYVFLVKNPAYYHLEQIWTNKGLDDAKRLAKLRFAKFKHKYYKSADYDKMQQLIEKHNAKVKTDTDKAIALLQANGFSVVSQNFAALSQ